MVVPSAGMIEQAQTRLADPAYRAQHSWVWPDQMQEVGEAVPGATDSFKSGFELGLETARVYLEGNAAAVAAKVSL